MRVKPIVYFGISSIKTVVIEGDGWVILMLSNATSRDWWKREVVRVQKKNEDEEKKNQYKMISP